MPAENSTTRNTPKLKDLIVWLPLATALIYFYSWLFEYVTCDKLHVPASLIEPTVGSILFFAGVLIFFTTAGTLFFTCMYLLLKDAGWKAVLITLPSLIALCIAAYAVNNWKFPTDDLWRMIRLGVYLWLGLLILGAAIQIFLKYDTWDRIFKAMFVDGSNELKAFIKTIKQYWQFALLLLLLPLTWLTALVYVGLNPPDTKLGKQNLVMVKKYGDILIFRTLDTKNNKLTDTIKIVKIDGGKSIDLQTITPAPAY